MVAMKSLSALFAFLLSTPLLLTAIPAQEKKEPTQASATRVEVPTFPNATCPIMGKKVSMPLFVDTSAGRFYVCCKPCFKKILADVPAATKTAYPTVKVVGNKVCPVSGEPIGKEAITVTLQGHSFEVCCEACVAAARANSQITLTKLLRQSVVDLGNTTCPVSGEPVAPNSFVLIGDTLVRLSSPKAVADVEKAPLATLEKARELRSKQPEPAKHVHTPKPATEATAREAGK